MSGRVVVMADWLAARYAAVIAECDRQIDALGGAPAYSLLDEIMPLGDPSVPFFNANANEEDPVTPPTDETPDTPAADPTPDPAPASGEPKEE